MSLSASSAPPTVAQTTAQLCIVPAWMARTLSMQLRAVSPRGGVGALLTPSAPPFDVRGAARAASFS